MSDAELTLEEVKLAVYALKNGRSPGLDQVAAEGIKAGGDTLLPRLHNLIKSIWKLDKVPSRWKKAIIIPIHKKGDSRECNNYRGISLLSVVGKVFMKILQSRLQMHREQMSREELAGFRPGRGCCDQIFALRQLVERYIRYGQTLEADHVPPKIISLLKSAYDGSTSLVRIRNDLSDEFEIKTGVRQGDVASPLLFNIVIDAIMCRAFNGRRGVQFADDQFVTDLMFADDSPIFAQDDAEAMASRSVPKRLRS
ncbi:putative 149 kDa protein [Labeo rohita]|uniref:149 kDa protein n=1 Tax=Labeo rohita TaxID=84645 RepID=A0ABQ8L1F1_LABRO|nr:putative 149 kDa protein [Labeo rohita]